MLSGLVNTLVLVLVVFAGASEPVITGVGAARPRLRLGAARGAHDPAGPASRSAGPPSRPPCMAATGAGLLALTPGDGALTAAGWVWPPAALALAVWMVRAARRAMTGRARWLLYPVIGALAVTAVGGTVESVALARDEGRYPMPGALLRRGRAPPAPELHRHRQPHRRARERPGETSPLWSGITAQVAGTTRVCAYDRAGQGWSDDVAHPQDGLAVAADLHTLLARAGEHGPYVLAGHSSGGTLRHDLRRPLPRRRSPGWCCSTRPARTSTPTSPTSPAPTR